MTVAPGEEREEEKAEEQETTDIEPSEGLEVPLHPEALHEKQENELVKEISANDEATPTAGIEDPEIGTMQLDPSEMEAAKETEEADVAADAMEFDGDRKINFVPADAPWKDRMWEVFTTFWPLGLIAFGGPQVSSFLMRLVFS